MDPTARKEAAGRLAGAWRSGKPLAHLPESMRPRDAAEAYAIQLATIAEMDDGVAGWKVAMSQEYGLLVGILARSRVFDDGAAISFAPTTMIGVEAEIAFRFARPLPPRERAYERAEVEAAVTAFPAIEIVDTRFRSYDGTPVIDRAADFMSNGAFVAGAPRQDWRSIDLASLEARLMIDGVEVVRRIGGHASGDPLIPAIAFSNHFRSSSGIAAGQMVTTGTFTGLQYAQRNSVVSATFVGFGGAECRFVG